MLHTPADFPLSEPRPVTFVLPNLHGGGAQQVALTFLRHLNPERFRLSLVLVSGAGELGGDVPAGVDRRDLNAGRLLRSLPRLLAALRALRPDVVFSTFPHMNLAVLALRPLLRWRPRIVVRESNTPSASLPSQAYARTLATGCRLLYPRADAVVCPSQRIAQEVARDFRVAAARIHLIRNPVDEDALRSRAALPERQPGPGPRFVAAGRLTWQKGFDRLLGAFAELEPSAHLTILGDGPEAGSLRARASEFGSRVSMPGYRASPWEQYAGADAFLVPSRWEGMPNAALEALAVGTPVIGTPEAGGLAEVSAEAEHEAITIGAFGGGFEAALRHVRAAPSQRLRATLLPPPYRAADAAAALAAVLLQPPPQAEMPVDIARPQGEN